MSKDQFYSRYQQLLKVKNTKAAKIGRGQDFEELVNDLFAEENILLKRSFHTSDNKSEQIDGAIWVLNRVILFEVKWVEKNLAASELYAFLGKIDNKLTGTLGIFISKNKLSDNFLHSIAKGRKRKVFVIHGDDIDLIFKNEIKVNDYIAHCIRLYSYDNLIHYSVKEWLEDKQNLLKAEEASSRIESKIDKVAVKNILQKILDDNLVPKHDINLDFDDLGGNEKIKICKYLLREYPTYYKAYIRSIFAKRGKIENVENSLKILLNIEEVTRETYLEYYKFYIQNPTISYIRDFLWCKYKNYYNNLKENVRSDFENALLKNFKSIFGSWEKENILTKVIEFLWQSFSEKTQIKLLEYYIDIFFSDRKDNYDQKQFALKIVNNKKYKKFVKKWIEKKIVEEIKSSKLTFDDIESEVNYFNRYYSKAQSILSLDETAWFSFLTKVFKENISRG